MKQIERTTLASAAVLTPAEMNRIHFGGLHSPVTPRNL